MKDKSVIPKGKGLLSSLNFDLKMDPGIKAALEKMNIKPSPEFPEIKTWRDGVASLGLQVASVKSPFDEDVKIEDQFIEANETRIRLRIYQLKNKRTDNPCFYWMHGGGLMGGSPEQDDIQMKQIVVETGATVVSVDYRLAPEHPFPTPLNDCYNGLMWVVNHRARLGIDLNRIALGGASAGGGLAAALAIMIKRKGELKLVHQSLTYPMLDDRNLTNSSFQITNLGLWDRSYNLFGWEAYLGSKHGRTYVPEFGAASRENNLSGLPPAFISVGSLDLFRDEDLEYALHLMEAGVSTEIHFYAGAVHGFDWHLPDGPMTISFLSKRINALKMAFAV